MITKVGNAGAMHILLAVLLVQICVGLKVLKKWGLHPVETCLNSSFMFET